MGHNGSWIRVAYWSSQSRDRISWLKWPQASEKSIAPLTRPILPQFHALPPSVPRRRYTKETACVPGLEPAKAVDEHGPTLVPRPVAPAQVERGDAHYDELVNFLRG